MISIYTNVPPRLRDGGAREWGDAQLGRVGAPPNFGEIHGGWGDIGVPGSKIIKTNININDKIPTITIQPM
jgi:hypothetical protein